jgi:hypothetical protein
MNMPKNISIAAVILLTSSAAGFATEWWVPPQPEAAPPALMPTWINPILVANNQVTLDAVGHNLDYHESTPLFPVFDSEKGWQPGVQITGSAMGNWGPIRNIYVMGQFTWISGKTNYWAPFGPPLGAPVSLQNGAEFMDFDFGVGQGIVVAPNWMLTPYVGVGFHSWDRDISNAIGPFGYHESYAHGYAGPGLLVQYAASGRIVLSGYGLIGSTFDPKMKTSFNGGAAMLQDTYGLNTSVIYKAGASADFALTPQWHLNVGADYTNFKYGASPVAPDRTNEPDSRTQIWTVKAGFGYSFYRPQRWSQTTTERLLSIAVASKHRLQGAACPSQPRAQTSRLL